MSAGRNRPLVSTSGRLAFPGPAEEAVLQPFGEQTKSGAVPEDQLDPVRPLRPEQTTPENGSAVMVSRTSVTSPSAPLRKSTGLVATITRTAPVGPITGSPGGVNDCRYRVCVRAAADPDRYAVDLNFDRSGIRLGLASWRLAARANSRRRHDHIPIPPAQIAILPLQNALPQLPSAGAAIRTTAVGTGHAAGPRRRPTHHSSRFCDDACLVFAAPGPRRPAP